MASATSIQIESAEEWDKTIKSANVVIADFHAVWCGPCKIISPHFETLAARFSNSSAKPFVVFCRVDVDKVQKVAQECNVRAMPTFLMYRDGQLMDVVQGASPPKLTAAVEKVVLEGVSEPTEAAQKWPHITAPSLNIMGLLPWVLIILYLIWLQFS